jgi:hypothetical protein
MVISTIYPFLFKHLKMGSTLTTFKEQQWLEKLANIKTTQDVCDGFFGGRE